MSVRTQIKYAKMKKSMEKSHKSSKKVVHNKYRRVKPLDYEDVRGVCFVSVRVETGMKEVVEKGVLW